MRDRHFDSPAVAAAIQTNRLTVRTNVDQTSLTEVISQELTRSFDEGCSDVGVYRNSNAATADLADALASQGIDNEIVGLPEAHAEALTTMAAALHFIHGTMSSDELRAAIAAFLTSIVRTDVPPLACSLLGRRAIPGPFATRLHEVEGKMAHSDSPLESAIGLLPALGIVEGQKAWARAARQFRQLTARLGTSGEGGAILDSIDRAIEGARTNALLSAEQPALGNIRLMTFHQAKGRESDAVFLVYESGDFLGSESEPFVNASRLLGVAVSRAKSKVVILLPPNPHPLVAPLQALPDG